jgi:hypothetical protein
MLWLQDIGVDACMAWLSLARVVGNACLKRNSPVCGVQTRTGECFLKNW